MNMQLPENIISFFENCKKNNVHPHSSDTHFNNLYLIQSIDMNGNVTDEMYGTNELTDDGFTMLPWDNSFFTQIYSDDESFTPVSLNWVSNSKESYSPVYYDSTTKMSTQYYIMEPTEYDYNYPDTDTDVTITKIGLLIKANSKNYLVAKSSIYDINGNVSSFVKHPNEKILLTVYLGASVNLDTILKREWTYGNYMLLSPLFFLRFAAGCTTGLSENKRLRLCFGMRTLRYSEADKATCVKYGKPFTTSMNPKVTKDYDVSDISSAYAESMIKYIDEERPDDAAVYEVNWVSKYIIYDFAFSSTNSVILMIDATGGIKLSNPEALVIDDCMTNTDDPSFTDTLFSYPANNAYPINRNDYRSKMEFAQFTCENVAVYNHKTQTWDSEAFTQDVNFLYEDTMFNKLWWPVVKDGSEIETAVYMNNKAGAYPITKIVSDALYIWATDTYWDTSTWEEVDKNNPGTLGTKRYYIVSPSTASAPVPYYDYTPLQLDNVPSGYTIPKTIETFSSNGIAVKVLSNPNRNCIIGYTQIIYPDDPSNVVTYDITNYGNEVITGDTTVAYTYDSGRKGSLSMFRLTDAGDKLVIAKRCKSTRDVNDNYAAGCYRVYTISDDKTVAPTYEDVQIPYTTQTFDTQTYHSFTDQGFVVATHNDDQEIAIMNLYGTNGVETEIIHGMWGYALNRTTRCVYLNTDDMSSLTFDVYDMSTKSIVTSFTLSGNYAMNGIMGWKNHVYVRVYDNVLQLYKVLYHDINDTSDTFVEVDVRLFDQTSSSCTMNSEPGGMFDNSFSSCDEAFFIYKKYSYDYDERTYREFLLILDNNPTVCRDLMAEHGWTKGSYDNVQMASNGLFTRNTDGSFVGLNVVEYVNTSSNIGQPNSRYPYSSPTDNLSDYILDIGRLYDNDYLSEVSVTNHMRHYNASGWGVNIQTDNHNSGIVYKNYRVYQSDSTHIKFEPLAFSRFHRVTGNTISIQTINNPKRIAPMDEFWIRISN